MEKYQYINLLKRIYEEGTDIYNKRTQKVCRVIIDANLTYEKCPLDTTRKSFYKASIAELLGYIRGLSSAADFRALGTNTWNANANENEAWLKNPNRKGEDDMGRVYGVQGRHWVGPNGEVDQLRKIYENLSAGIDDRGEILSYWNPGEIELGCLRSCVHTYTFSLVHDTLHVTVYQRSADVPLGLNFDLIQAYTFLHLMAQITRNKPGKMFYKIVNAHIYEDQLPMVPTQISREPFDEPQLIINPNIKSLEDVETWVTTDDFKIVNYQHHEPIKYPFSV
ncbi:thymidylate synthase [Morganella phage vB_MmoM_MP1]|uniref:thymidylate synthase n=1 Tax=Morganella phage vB_MmoM_MP1 TaxID=1852628 RepID=A0A192YA66_9CAUD|nr:thymidylate synthase [Morganella phage vB_MmoM_MP1]ANM46442.1 thymidylate synthase [Morganella phage vB_MmoM_MP1]